MNKNMWLIISVVLVAVLVGGFLIFKGGMGSSQTATPTVTDNTPSAVPSVSATDSMDMSAMTKEFTVTGSSFKFDPPTLTVNKGDKVKITFNNSGGMHDFVIDEFNAKTKVIRSGETDTAEFTADKSGTFEYYCSVGNHRAMGMKGTLTVN